jgi:alkylhydroperoxidase family enzyme
MTTCAGTGQSSIRRGEVRQKGPDGGRGPDEPQARTEGRRPRRADLDGRRWREAPHFSDAERAPLALAEAATRLSDRSDPVPDEIWEEAARHHDDAALTSLVLSNAAINAWNKLNLTTRQPAGSWS